MPPPTWLIEQTRVTVFTLPNATIDYSGWWAALATNEPDQVNQQPKIGLYQARGHFDDDKDLVLQIKDNRIDWFFVPPQPTVEPPRLPSVGNFPEALDAFVTLIQRWLPSCPDASRLALGGVLFQPQADRNVAYVQLQKYLPAVRLDPRTSEFLYQINRPRNTQTGIPQLRINRLTKWSVMLLQSLLIAAGEGSPTVTGTHREVACRLEVDLNSSAEFVGPLPPDRLVPLLNELATWAKEIAISGDVD